MILIADSGSTKTEWVVLNKKRPEPSVFTNGISPVYLSGNEIFDLLNIELSVVKNLPIRKVYFYGTGCNSTENNSIVKLSICKFLGIDDVFVGSDVLGAARSLCLNKPGIACILGTGSNSCFYDGQKIVSNISPLGYILGDEGSAAAIGRKLLSDILKNQLSEKVINLFSKTYNITTEEIIDSVYKKPFPNRFLGQFAKFISSNKDIAELEQIVISSFDDFIIRNVLRYPESKLYPIHFTGSVAYNFRAQLETSLRKHDLIQGTVSLTPMKNLIEYHLNFSYKN